MMMHQGVREAHRQFVVKGVVTVVSALIFVAGLTLLLVELTTALFAGADGLVAALLPPAISAVGIYLFSWINCHSFKKSLFTVFIVLILGLPLALGILLPVTAWLMALLLPGTSLPASASLAAAWFIILPPVICELLTGPVIAHRRWARLIVGGALSFVLILFVEFTTESAGSSGWLDWIRMLLYAPLTWILIDYLVSVPKASRHDD